MPPEQIALLRNLQAQVANQTAISPPRGFEPFGNGVEISVQAFNGGPALIAQRAVNDRLCARMIAVKNCRGEGLLRPKMIGEAALRNARLRGDLTDSGAGETTFVQRPHAGLDNFFAK